MKLGFHYHIPAFINDSNQIFVPGYLGVFLEGIAKECKTLVCFLHVDNINNNRFDYCLTANNITLVNLGKPKNIIYRTIFGFKYVKTIQENINNVDIFLVRGPTPLLPVFAKLLLRNGLPYSFLIVGDYIKSFNAAKITNILKYYILKYIYKRNRKLQDKYSNKAIRITNNPLIRLEMTEQFGQTSEIRTTTLNKVDLIGEKNHSECWSGNIFYAGRIESGKGLDDLINAIEILLCSGHKVCLKIAGWDPSINENYKKHLQLQIKNKNLSSAIKFIGKKTVGTELFECYRASDVFISPSTGNEGFPRTIWEAMAQKIPVISTKVGAVPIVLTNNENALLVKSHSPVEIADAIIKLLSSYSLRKKLTENGYNIAKENTIEKQCYKLATILREYLSDTKTL